MEYLKKATGVSAARDTATEETVSGLLEELRRDGEDAVRKYNLQFDNYSGDVVLPASAVREATRLLPDSVKDDLRFAHARVSEFAKRQEESMHEFEAELGDGIVAGQRLIPVSAAGCYVPGGRYAHAASAIMSVATAKVAGVENIIAATPGSGENGVNPAILFAMDLSGANSVLVAGGVQGIAAMAYGLFTGHPADIIVGPGNRFVAEAKRQLFGGIGIDVIAGPTESLVIADGNADPSMVAADLAGQAEHGSDSPVWLITTSREVAEEVLRIISDVIGALPEPARSVAGSAWQDFGEIVIADSREEACDISDRYAAEHLHVQADDLDWWLARLRNYGSLFLGEETTVAFGDKCSGPNHILPTRGAARYTGGLSVAKFIKVLTYQRMSRAAAREVAPVAARISRLEGMEGHARTGDARLRKYYPDQEFELQSAAVDWSAD